VLSNINIASYLTDRLNEVGKDTEDLFVIYDGAGHNKKEDVGKIKGILKQVGDNYVNPKMNYININGQYEVELLVSVLSGFSRAEDIIKIVNNVINGLNGVPISIAEGRAIFSFKVPKSGELAVREAEGNSVIIRFNFGLEYAENDSTGITYEMALIDNPFCGTVNTRYFNSQSEQQAWYLNRIENGGIPFSKTFAPNINSLLISQQVYINEQGLELNEILLKNYAIIRAVKNSTPMYYYYYEVQSANINGNNQPIFDLKLDTLQTYYFNPDIVFSDCHINKAHLDRLKATMSNGEVVYRFKFNEESPLFEREELRNVAKRPILKEKLYPQLDTVGQGSPFNDWYKNNISHWVYYYISGGKTYNFASATGGSINSELDEIKYKINDDTYIDGSIVVLVAPIYKSTKKIKMYYKDPTVDTGEYMVWDEAALKRFITGQSATGGYANVVAIKHSVLPPFYTAYLTPLVSVDDVGDLLFHNNGGTTTPTINNGNTYFEYFEDCVDFMCPFSNPTSCFGRVVYQDIKKTVQMYPEKTFLYRYQFSRDDVLADIAIEWEDGIEPKLLNEDYSTYRLFIGGNSYDLPISKTSPRPSFIYKEILTPDITKALLIYDPENSLNDSGVFTDINTKDFTGFMINIDLSMWFATDALDSYLATNKNNLQIFNNNQKMKETDYLVNAGSSLFSGILMGAMSGGAAGAAVGAVSGGINGIVNGVNLINQQRNERTNYNLSLDNMAQSPETLSSLNSNIVLMQAVDDLGIYIELQQPLTHEKKILIDGFKLYGYTYNRIGNVKNFDKTRKYFNYIEAIIESISGVSMTNAARDDIKQRFANGIRFWRNDEVDYSLVNCEISV